VRVRGNLPSGWVDLARRPLAWPGPVGMPPAAWIVLVWVLLNWIVSTLWLNLRLDEAFRVYQTPTLFGGSLGWLLAGVDALLAAYAILVFIDQTRAPRRRGRTARVACLLSVCLLIPLGAYHLGVASYPAAEFESDEWFCACSVGDDSFCLRVRKELVAPDTEKRLSELAAQAGGRGRLFNNDFLVVTVPKGPLAIPLRGFTLEYEGGELRGGDLRYGRLEEDDTVRVTPVGVFVRGQHRGELPR